MRRVVTLAICALVWFSLASCIKRREWNRPRNDLDLLMSWMTGSFTSEEQAAGDTGYLDVRLEIVPIWPERDDGYWLYVEQATADNLERPSVQRVYHLVQLDDSTYLNGVYDLDEPSQFAGQWRNPETFSTLTLASLIGREGCAVFMHKRGDTAFAGSTDGRACRSNFRGAAYMTSQVRVTGDHLVTWDRGFDSAGVQVWGAERGGYLFQKVRNQ